MSFKALMWILILAAVAAGVWGWGGEAAPMRTLQGWVRTGSAAPAAALHKCVQGSAVTYTDQPCAAGERQRPVQGAVTVLPAARPTTAGAASAGASSPLRRLAGPELAPDLQQRRIDEAVQR